MIMEWTQFVIFCLGVFGLFIWNRTENRTDMRHMDSKLESNRNLSLSIHQENNQIIESVRNESRTLIESVRTESRALIEAVRVESITLVEAIRQDMKDFHGRLCAIEERNKGK